MLSQIIQYFLNDPMKLIYLLGGSGGIYFWYEKWKYRTRVEFNISSETYDPRNDNVLVTINFTCRNIGNIKTSLQRNIEVTAYSKTGGLQKYLFSISGNSLELPPHEVKVLQATANLSARYIFSLFRAYTIKTTINQKAAFYSYKTYREKCSHLKRDLGIFLLKYFNINPREVENGV